MRTRHRQPLSFLILLVATALVASDAPDPVLRGFTPTRSQAQRALEEKFLAVPDPARAEAHHKTLTADPHVAGSPADRRTLMGFNGYSASGDATAEVVYAHHGLPADYQRLREEGVSAEGKIVIARYGGSFRGVKAKVAEENKAAALIIYSDPEDDGYHGGDTYPDGPWRPASTGKDLREKHEWALAQGLQPPHLDRVNRALVEAEQAFLLPEGLPGRPWFRHANFAPGTYTGYASVPLPGVHESIDAGDFDQARHQLEALTAAITRATDTLESAGRQVQ